MKEGLKIMGVGITIGVVGVIIGDFLLHSFAVSLIAVVIGGLMLLGGLGKFVGAT